MRYEDANWQKAMRLKVDYNNMLAGYSKAAAAITPQEIAALKDKAAEAFQFIAQNRGKGTMEWSELPYNQDAGAVRAQLHHQLPASAAGRAHPSVRHYGYQFVDLLLAAGNHVGDGRPLCAHP